MVQRVQVRTITNDEGNRLLRIVRRSSGSVVTWRRAQMVLLSAQGMDVAGIAKVTFTSSLSPAATVAGIVGGLASVNSGSLVDARSSADTTHGIVPVFSIWKSTAPRTPELNPAKLLNVIVLAWLGLSERLPLASQVALVTFGIVCG